MAGELVNIGPRPRTVASFEGRDAYDRFRAWRDEHAAVLDAVPPEAMRVEYGQLGTSGERYVRVRIDESHVPPTF